MRMNMTGKCLQQGCEFQISLSNAVRITLLPMPEPPTCIVRIGGLMREERILQLVYLLIIGLPQMNIWRSFI